MQGSGRSIIKHAPQTTLLLLVEQLASWPPSRRSIDLVGGRRGRAENEGRGRRPRVVLILLCYTHLNAVRVAGNEGDGMHGSNPIPQRHLILRCGVADPSECRRLQLL